MRNIFVDTHMRVEFICKIKNKFLIPWIVYKAQLHFHYNYPLVRMPLNFFTKEF